MPKRAKPIIAALPSGEELDFEAIRLGYLGGDIDLICVLGPTASGKTRYAVRLAKALGNAEIISADSRQVFRGMDIGTGKDLSEYGDIPYHLIDILPAGEPYNVFRYQCDFLEAYRGIRSRGAIPILCGGTGLYIEAACCGYTFDKDKPREKIEGLPQKTFYIGTLVSREERVARIDRRLEERLREGMVDEIRGLLESGVSSQKLKSYGLEYKFITQFVLGEIGYEEMVSKLAIAIHQFAKRQMTWFRGMEHDGIEIHWTEVCSHI